MNLGDGVFGECLVNSSATSRKFRFFKHISYRTSFEFFFFIFNKYKKNLKWTIDPPPLCI